MIKNYIGSVPLSIFVDSNTKSTFKIPEYIIKTLTIVPTPSDATVIINGEERNTITVTKGTNVTYSVSKEGYPTIEESIVVNHTTTLNVELKKEPRNYVDVEDYEYDLGDDEVILSTYIGQEQIVTIPTVQVEQ